MMPEATVSNEESAYRAKYYNGITSVRRGDLFCSSCGNTISFEADTFYSHPFLGILQCQACSDSFRSFKSKVSAKAWKRRCLMCGSDNCQTLFPCPVKGCPYSFCKNCIKRNASSALLLADTPNWKCFVCMTNPLWQARGICDTLLSASPRRKKKKKTVREESSDEDYLDNIKAKMASEKRPRVLRKSVTKPSSDAPTRRPTRNASKTTVNQIEDSDDNLEIVSVKKSKKSFKLKTSTTSKRKPSSERSSVERSSSPESSGRHSKLSTTEPVRRTRGASSDSRKGSTKGITQSCQKVKRQNSDSSSGKEFTQTKLIRESYVPLQRLSIGEKDFTHPPDEPGSPEGTILTKQQMFSLKNSIQDFINNLKSTSKKMIHVAESLQRQYSQKEMIRPAEATKWIAECKTTASAFTKKINNNEHALVDRFDSWCKKYKVKNIFISANGIDDSDSPLRSGFDTLRTRKQVKSSNVIPSSDEEDEDNVRSKGQASSVEKTPDVSECEIAEIFSQDETHPSRSTDKILSPVREEIGTGDIESPESSSARLSRSPEVVDGAEARGAEKVNSRGSSEDIFADFECEAKEQGKIKTERKSKEREVASSNDEISSPGPKSSKKSRKSREKKENSRKESLEHLPLSDSGSEEKNVKGEEKNFKESEKKKNRILSSSGDSDDDASSKMRANTASPRSSEGKKKSKSEMKKRRKNSSSIKNSGSSSDERKNKSQDSSADDQRLMKSTKKKNKKSNLVSSNLNQSEDEKIDDGIESRSSEARAREALLESDSSENQEEITANSSDKSTDQAGPSIEEDNSLQSIVESPAKNTKSKKSKSSIQQEDSSPDTHSKKKKRKRSLSSSHDSIELPEESATEQPLSFEASNTDHQTNNSQENSDGSFMTANDEVCSTQLTVKRDNSKDSAAELSQHSNISNAETIIQDQLVEDSKNTPPKDVSDEQHAKQYLLQSSSDDSFNESVDESTKKGSSSEASVNEEILKKSSRTIDSLSSIDETGALDESEKSEDKRDTDAEERAKKALMTSSSDEVEMDRTVEISEPEVSHIEETTNDSPLVPEISSDKASDGPVSQGMEERAKEALLDSDCSSVDVNSGSLVESGNYSSAERPDKTRDRTEMKKTGESDSGTEAAAPYLKGKSQKSASSGSKDLEENAKKYLLNSSSDENEGSVKKKRLLTRPVDSSHHDSDSMFSSPRVKRRKLDMKKSEFFKNDEKLKLGCSVVVNRLSNVILRRHARALKKSKEYLEDKALRSLTTLDGLEKTRKRDKGNISETSDATSTSRARKKTSKDSETLADHLNVNGEHMETGTSSEEEVDAGEKSQASGDLQDNVEVLAKNALLDTSDEDKPVVLSSDEESAESDNKKVKSKKSVDESTSSRSTKADWKKSKLLTMKLSSSDEEEQSQKFDKKVKKLSQKDSDDSDLEDETKKKKRVRRRRLNSDSDIQLTDEEPSSDSVKSVKSEKKGKRRLKKMNDSSDSNDSSATNSRVKPKRRRVRTAGTDSDSDIEEINTSQGSPTKSGRKNIRKVIKDTKVADDTKQAAKQEEERLKRMAERQKLYNELYEARLAGEEKVDKLILDFDEDSKEELLSVHEALVKRLKPHQAQGIKFMWDACFESLERANSTSGSGCILAHCMGLGKSFQVVTLTHTLLVNSEKTGVRTVLVVCPLSTVLNWVNEFKIWLNEVNDGDDVEVYELTRFKLNTDRRFQLGRWQKTGGVMILGYEMYRNLSNPVKKINKKMGEAFLQCLVAPGPDLVICDEGHLLKSETTAISKAMSKIKTLRRIVLTGTPLQNNLTEYHCMVQFVKPNLLGTKKEFLNRFVNPIQNGQFDDSTEYDVKLMKKRAHVLHKMLEGSVQRFDYSVLTPFLPPKQEYVIFVKLSEIQVKLYQYYIDNLARRHKGAGGSLFADFQALQRIWTHPIAIKLNADKTAEKKMREASDSEGSLKDFIDDGSDEDSSKSDTSIASTSSSKSKKSDVPVKKHTRANADIEELVTAEVQEPQQEQEWWTQFVEEEHFEDLRISGKLRILFEILKESENIGDKVLVFSQSLYSLTLIERFLSVIDDETQQGNSSELIDGHTGSWSLGLDYFRLDGQTNTENRSLWCKQFNRPSNTRARLFLISTRAGGLGINLTAANRVVIFDASWNPSHDVQSIFRIYRFGQKKPCYVYRLLAAGTMEEKIYNRQVTKLSLSCRVVDEQQIERHYTNSDLAELYKLDIPPDTRETIGCPKDRLLAEIFSKHKDIVVNFHEHDSLLENKADEELDEEERKQAWLEYEQEKAGRPAVNPTMNLPFNYQEQMLQLYNAQMMGAFPNGNPTQLELNYLQSFYEKDFPKMTPEQQRISATKTLMNMYNYVENQAVMSNRVPQVPMGAATAGYSNPTNTLANQLAQEAYTRHHQQAKQTAYQRQLLYAQQHGNFKSVPGAAQRSSKNPNPFARRSNTLQGRANPVDNPDILEIIPSAAQSSSAQGNPSKYQEE